MNQSMTKDQRLVIVLLLNVSMVVALVIVGLASHSLGVLAAGADYLGDAAGVAISLVALRISRHPHGHPKATSYAALANASFLLLITTVVGIEALHRILGGTPEVHGLPVLIVSAIAALVMIFGAFILGNIESSDFNMRSVMLDTVADAAAAAGVAVGGAIILIADGLYWLDSAIALAVALVVGLHALRLLREVVVDLRKSRPGGEQRRDLP